MPTFSERNGYVIKPLQIDSISETLRNRIWNTYICEIYVGSYDSIDANYLEEIMDACGLTLIPINNETDLDQNKSAFRQGFIQTEWYRIFDFIEIYLSYLPAQDRKVARNNFNSIFEAENAGYRIIGTQVTSITNKDEISCIEKAQKNKYHAISTHITKAIELLSRRPNPDYENSIKESISAVESMCSIITEIKGKNATLGNTIKHLKDKGVHIHPAMESAYSSLYGYTNDEGGIRHGSMDFKDAPVEDAKYMLVSCSAFVNYLMEKWSKVSST